MFTQTTSINPSTHTSAHARLAIPSGSAGVKAPGGGCGSAGVKAPGGGCGPVGVKAPGGGC